VAVCRYAALGDVAKARYLRRVNELGGAEEREARARLATLNKQFQLAETIYLEDGQTDEAIQMWVISTAAASAPPHRSRFLPPFFLPTSRAYTRVLVRHRD